MEILPKLNESLLKKAFEQIKKFPEAYNQGIITGTTEITQETPCGAEGCLGGWIVLLSMPKDERHGEAKLLDNNDTLQQAGEMVGFTESERDYVFNSTGEIDPKKNYRIVLRRVQKVREARKKLLNSKLYKAKVLVEEARDKNGDELHIDVAGTSADENATLDYSDLFDF